jgi:hypothetical protein
MMLSWAAMAGVDDANSIAPAAKNERIEVFIY